MRAKSGWWLVLGVLGILAGCDQPRVVDCGTGRFVRTDGDGWCVYRASDATTCPRLVPVEHRLSGGARGCATRDHDPTPESLCEAAGTCPTDAGMGG